MTYWFIPSWSSWEDELLRGSAVGERGCGMRWNFVEM